MSATDRAASSAAVRVLRTLTFRDGTMHHEELVHIWHGYTAQQAYAERAARLRNAKAAATYDRRNRSITVRWKLDSWTEIETLQFEEAPTGGRDSAALPTADTHVVARTTEGGSDV